MIYELMHGVTRHITVREFNAKSGSNNPAAPAAAMIMQLLGGIEHLPV